ncbi:hypothetical protein B0T14DRAFT_300056 [Immersiella caudata]|uniref:Uncharacterized protein n=1 Tax=Immersiella caudata TaxID=314043 RepID=A0AA39WF42_9PEZI|nr:hypothetical protein B0T14DRAFT_300056 [Immersiella caudata]
MWLAGKPSGLPPRQPCPGTAPTKPSAKPEGLLSICRKTHPVLAIIPAPPASSLTLPGWRAPCTSIGKHYQDGAMRLCVLRRYSGAHQTCAQSIRPEMNRIYTRKARRGQVEGKKNLRHFLADAKCRSSDAQGGCALHQICLPYVGTLPTHARSHPSLHPRPMIVL